MKGEEDIDIVILWVDGNDDKWIKKCAQYSDKPLDRIRFEDGGTLKYVFRSIEKFLPWVRNIYLITPGHHPNWLNLKHSKLKLISQDELFQDKTVLPVFNSCSVEVNLHKIEGLSEQFIYFNDDMIILKELNENYFFKNGKANDFFIITRLFHHTVFSHQMHSQMQLINDEIRKDKSMIKQFLRTINLKYGLFNIFRSTILMFFNRGEISLFSLNHHPQAYIKSNFIELEQLYPEVIARTSASRFRTEYQVSQTIYRFWALIKGRYNPTYHNDALYIGVSMLSDFKRQLKKIENKKRISMICFNEHEDFDTSRYEEYKKIVSSFLDKRLGSKSSYEI